MIFVRTSRRKNLITIAGEKETEDFFARKTVALMGLKSERKMGGELNYYMNRRYSPNSMTKILERQKALGMFTQVQVEGGRETYLVLTEDIRGFGFA